MNKVVVNGYDIKAFAGAMLLEKGILLLTKVHTESSPAEANAGICELARFA